MALLLPFSVEIYNLILCIYLFINVYIFILFYFSHCCLLAALLFSSFIFLLHCLLCTAFSGTSSQQVYLVRCTQNKHETSYLPHLSPALPSLLLCLATSSLYVFAVAACLAKAKNASYLAAKPRLKRRCRCPLHVNPFND